MNLCDILKERDLRGKRNESLMFNCLEDSFLANYETEPYDFIHSSDNPLSTIAIAVSPDGDTVATTHGDHTVKVFKLSSGKSLRTFIGHPRTPWTVKYNPANSCILASGCLGFEVRVWDIMHGSLLNLLRLDSCVITLAFHPSGEFILASSGPHLHTWCWKEGETSNNLNTNLSSSSSAPSVKRKSRIVTHSRNIRAVVFHPSGRFVFVAAPDPPMGPDPTRGPTAANRLYGFAFSTLFSGPYLEPILLMNQRTVIPEIHVYSDGGLDISRDGRYLVTGALAYVCQTVPYSTSINTQGISAIEQLERLPSFWTSSGAQEGNGSEDNVSLPLTPRSALFHPGATIPPTFPAVSGSSSSSSVRQSPLTIAPIHRRVLDSCASNKPIFFDPVLDRADTIVGMRPQEMICIFRIVDSAEAFGPGDRLAADSVSLEIVQCRDISSSLMKAVTSIKFSPTARVAVLAYGVRREGAVEGHPAQNVACEVVRFSNEGSYGFSKDSLRTVAIIANTEDEVNIAQFHAIPGLGIVYGTKQGKVRIYRHKSKYK